MYAYTFILIFDISMVPTMQHAQKSWQSVGTQNIYSFVRWRSFWSVILALVCILWWLLSWLYTFISNVKTSPKNHAELSCTCDGQRCENVESRLWTCSCIQIYVFRGKKHYVVLFNVDWTIVNTQLKKIVHE